MNEQIEDHESIIYAVAEKALHWYVQGILTRESLRAQIICEWEERRIEKDRPSYTLLMRIAQRICSLELYAAWRSSNIDRCNCAFANLRRYLECSLRNSSYRTSLQDYANATEDVVHQALETLHLQLMQGEHGGPKDPATFLRWTQIIALRQMRVFLQKARHDTGLSLEVQMELFSEQFVDNSDPLDYVLLRELRETLCTAILAMRNLHYQQVLIYTYIAGVDEHELAHRLHVQVQKIYLWRHRALKALRNQPGVEKILRSLL